MKRTLLTVLAAFLPISAAAGTFDAESGTYESYMGYEITPPKGWIYADTSNIGAMKDSLPANISAKALERLDVVFFPPFAGDLQSTSLKADDERRAKNDEAKADDPSISAEELLKPVTGFTGAPGFSSALSVMSVRAKFEPNAEAPKAYEKELIARVKKNTSIENFKVTNSTFDNGLAPGDAYLFSYEFSYKGSKTVAVDQTILFHGDRMLIISCTQDVEEFVKNKKWCKQAVNSVHFND